MTRKDTEAILFIEAATSFKRCSSGMDSTLKHRMSCVKAKRISSIDFPTPEKITLRGSPPAARTRNSSPPETMSKPEPSLLNTFSTARLELDLTE